LNVQAGTQFCDGGFEGEVAAGRISSSSLDKYSCVALAGEFRVEAFGALAAPDWTV
jgi:hypothetical protein